MFEKWNMLKILNMIEAPSSKKEYTYNQMPCINSKPTLQRGNENLLEFAVFLPLHFSFCNPKKVIETIEKFALEGDITDWVYQKQYMGQFTVNSVEKTLTKVLKGTVIYAEVNFNLLEVPPDPNFKPEGEAALIDETKAVGEKHPKIKELTAKAKISAVESFKENISTALLNTSLTDMGKELVRTVSNSVVNDLTGVNVGDLYNTVGAYADAVKNNDNLSPAEAFNVAQSIRAIPELMLDGSLRGGF